MSLIKQRILTLLTFIFWIVISLTKTACKKSEPLTVEKDLDIIERFLKIPVNANPALKSIVADLREKDLKHPFIVSLARRKGFPNWEKAIIKSIAQARTASASMDTFVLFSLVQDNDRVSSLINCKLSGSISYKLFSGNDYWKAGFNNGTYNANNFVGLMLFMEYENFGRKYFILNDGRLFKNNVMQSDSAKKEAVRFSINTQAVSNETAISNAPIYIEMEVCYDVYAPCTGQATGCPPNDANCNPYCTTSTCVTLASWWNNTTLEWLEDPTNPTNGGSGSGGGGSPSGNNYGWIPTVEDITNIVNLLQNLLGLNSQQAYWLQSHSDRAMEILRYLQASNAPNEGEIIISHINKMMDDAPYLSFVQNHAASMTNLMWWQDQQWLNQIQFSMPEVAFNFYMRVTNPPNKKPEEFSVRCEGLKAMAQRTRNDNKERLGFITLDGKFIITEIGDAETVKINVQKENGQLYYYYPLQLGMPNLNYYGIIVDTVNQQVRIPIRASVHTHPPGGVSIDYQNSRSENDLDFAQSISDILGFYNHVIEIFGATYKTGMFDGDETGNPYNTYFNTHAGLALNDICTHIN